MWNSFQVTVDINIKTNLWHFLFYNPLKWSVPVWLYPLWHVFVIENTAGRTGTLCSLPKSWRAAVRSDLAPHSFSSARVICVPLATSRSPVSVPLSSAYNWRSHPLNYPQFSWFPGLVLTAAQFIFDRVTHRGLFRRSAFPRRVEQVCCVCVCEWPFHWIDLRQLHFSAEVMIRTSCT